MQEVCLRLMGKKLLVALAMEGKFAADGLQGIDGDDDMLTAMARELVENRGIGETAAAVWRSVGELRPSTAAPAEEEPIVPSVGTGENTPESPLSPLRDIPSLATGNESSRPPSPRVSATGQLSLF